MLTESEFRELQKKIEETLHNDIQGFVGGPRGFTKRQAADLKAGISDGVSAAFRALKKHVVSE